MEKAISFIKENAKRFESEMIDWLKIESVSTDPNRKGETRKAAEWAANKLKNIGIEKVELMETGLHPVVYGEWMHAKGAPTILVYGHYDVQPPEPLEKWTTPPFSPTIKDGYIYGRGTADDKGQFITHLFALEALMKTEGKLPVNVKFFIEGEEECGSMHTSPFVIDHKELLACDAVAISDTNWHTDDTITMVYAMRGMCYMQVDVKGPCKDLHSGMFGGVILNPMNAIAKIIAKLQNDDGVIQIPHYYDDVAKLSPVEKKEFASIGNHDEELKRDLGVNELWGEKGFTSTERNWARPSLEIHGIWGGYSGPGQKTVIPSEGGFKVSSRLVANMKPEKAVEQFRKFFEDVCPPGITLKFNLLQMAPPVMVPIDNPFVKIAAGAIEAGFGKKPTMVREGASIPITATFQSELGAVPLLVGFSVPSDSIHSPNERFKMENFHKGIVTNAHLYKNLATVKR